MLSYYNIIYTSLKYSIGMIPYIPNIPNLLELIEEKKQRDYDRAMQPALERERIAKMILNQKPLNEVDRLDAVRMGFLSIKLEINQERLEFYKD